MFQQISIGDEVRVVQTSVESFNAYDAVTTHPAFPPVVIGLALCMMLLCVPALRLWAWNWTRAWGIYALGTRGRWKMQRERRAKRNAQIGKVLLNFFEAQVQHERWTRTEANEEYGRYAKFHSEFVHARETPGTVKERIVERLKNYDREPPAVDAKPNKFGLLLGRIKAVALPDKTKEVPAKQKLAFHSHEM